ncbi:MAG: hypothetical protein ABSH10_08605 [Phycisphaerae bacterium]
MRRRLAWLMMIGLWSGCSGGYVLTAPDSLASTDGPVQAVVRLQWKELPWVTPPAQAAPLRFQVADGPLRSARTDKNGCASVALPAPKTAGEYPLTVALQDIEGREESWELRAFVWDPDRIVIAVDLDAVPLGGREIIEARTALLRLAGQAHILYLSDDPVWRFPALHAAMEAAGLPEGPILPWREERWWEEDWRKKNWREKGWWRSQIVSPLDELRREFPKLQVGIAGSELAVQAFDSAGMKCLLVRSTKLTAFGMWGGQATQPSGSTELAGTTSWAKLAAEGL